MCRIVFGCFYCAILLQNALNQRTKPRWTKHNATFMRELKPALSRASQLARLHLIYNDSHKVYKRKSTLMKWRPRSSIFKAHLLICIYICDPSNLCSKCATFMNSSLYSRLVAKNFPARILIIIINNCYLLQ